VTRGSPDRRRGPAAAEATLADSARQILGRDLGVSEANRIHKYLDLLTKWQRVYRLVGSSDPHWLTENVLLDSLLYLKVLPSSIGTIVDLGAGAGIPGVPLAIVLPQTTVTLVEARQKRVSFLAAVIRELEVHNLRLVGSRLDLVTIPPEMIAAFDAAVMRCAGALDDVMAIGRRLVRPSGLVVASGPPRPGPLSQGEWVTVAGTSPGSTRHFAVVHVPRDGSAR
jgi:16S rRNA (guanine527-N7)-methyltransferase